MRNDPRQLDDWMSWVGANALKSSRESTENRAIYIPCTHGFLLCPSRLSPATWLDATGPAGRLFPFRKPVTAPIRAYGCHARDACRVRSGSAGAESRSRAAHRRKPAVAHDALGAGRRRAIGRGGTERRAG